MSQPKKIAIVTGGGSGLGLAIAEKFTRAGIITIITGRNEQKLEEAKKQLGALCHTRICDITQFTTIPGFVKGILTDFGKVDILVNNAGINQKKSFLDVTDEDFQHILATNTTGVFVMSREVAKEMCERRSGCIINISSMAALYGIPKVISYTASKAAIDGMTKAMAVELSPLGIRVNAIAPGFIYSEMSAKALNSDPERKARVLSRTPMGEMGQASDIGDAALFLAGDSARYITGVILPVDGGNNIGF